MSFTRARIIQWIGIILALSMLGAGYWYFSARAGVKTNTGGTQPQGTGSLDSGLVGYWKLDDGSGTSATDSSTNANAGTLTNGPTWTTGQIGSGVNFDGTNDYIAANGIAGTTSPIGSGDVSFSAWVKPSSSHSSASAQKAIMMFNNPASSNDVYLHFNTDPTQGTDGALCYTVYDTTFYSSCTTQVSWTSGSWIHVVGTYSQASGSKLYVNGSLAGTNTHVGRGTTKTPDFSIGSNDAQGGFFPGTIDEVRVYNRPLLAEEVSQLYSLTTPTGTDTNLKGYWSFNGQDVSGTTAYDRSGAGNAGTLTNGPVATTGRAGQALDLDGSNDFVSVADNASLDATDTVDLTLTGWFNRDTTGTTDAIIAKRNSNSAADVGYLLYIDNATSKLVFEVSDGVDEYSLTSATAFASTGWHAFAVTWDQDSAANSELYVDGVSVGATDAGTIGNIGDLSNALTLVFGSESDGGTPFDGKLDELRIYKRVLPAGEIKSLYDLGQSDKTNTSASQSDGTGRLSSGLFAYFPLDENTGTSTADASTNGNAGTLTNGPAWVTGQVGSAVDFDGTNDYVTTATANTFVTAHGAPHSGFAWVYPQGLTALGYKSIISVGEADDAAFATGLGLYDSTGEVVWTQDGYDAPHVSSGFTAPLNQWSFVGYMRTATEVTFFVNGNTSTVASAAASGIQSDPVLIGASGHNAVIGGFFNGYIDEARLYNRTLSIDEATQLYRLIVPTSVDTGLKGYWSFNGPDVSGTTVYDRSGAASTNATLSNSPVVTLGRIGQAFDFNGSTMFGSVSDVASLDVGDTDSLTLSGWFNRDTFTTDDTIVAKRNGIVATDAGYIVYIDDATDQLIFEVSDGTDEYSLTSPSTFTAVGWHHFVIVWDPASAANSEIYIDGVAVGATDAGTIGNIGDLSNALALKFAAESDNGNLFDGKLDEPRVYKRALTATEIKAQYDFAAPDKANTSASQSQGAGNLDSGLAGYWKLDENTGTSATDASTNANAGTLTNGPAWTTGQTGSAVDFDGVDDYILSPSTSFLTSTLSQHSFFAWVYPQSFAAATTRSVVGYGEYDDSLRAVGLGIHDSTGKVVFLTNGYFGSQLESGLTVPLNQWSFIGYSKVATDKVRFFVNGSVTEVTDSNGSTAISSPDRFMIGVTSRNATLGGYFDGYIDEVRAYNRLLSIDEMAQLYRLTAPTGVDTSLKGYWSFNGQDVSGTTAYDRSGAGNNGTLTNGPVAGIGKVGQSLSFDGTNDYVTVPDANSLDLSSSHTMSAWVKWTATPTGVDEIVGKGTAGTTANYYMFWSGGLVCGLTYSGGTSSSHSASMSLEVGKWYHFACVFDDTANTYKLYVDGIEVNSEAETHTPDTDAGTVAIGRSARWAGDYVVGSIDEVRLYSRALSLSEIQQLYKQSR